jgi:hypothetical protein
LQSNEPGLNKISNIQIRLTWLLLALFTFSITPRQVLHDILANHTDAVETVPKGQSAIAKKSFSCDRLNLVAESPFTGEDAPAPTVLPRHITGYVQLAGQSITIRSINLPALRGPPAC